MIKTSIFCPVERVATLLAKTFEKEGVVRLTIDYEGRVFTYVKTEGLDYKMGVPESLRREIMSKDTVLFTVMLFSLENSKRYSVTLLNDLMTDTNVPTKLTFQDQTVINGEHSAYREPLTTVAERFEMKPPSEHEADMLRPFYQYFVAGISDSEIVVRGPWNGLFHVVCSGEISHGGVSYRLFSPGELLGAHGDVVNVSTDTISASTAAIGRVFLKYGTYVEEFKFGQQFQFVSFGTVDAPDVIRLLGVCIYAECVRDGFVPDIGLLGSIFELNESGDITISVESFLERVRLPASLRDEIDTVVMSNAIVSQIMKCYVASNDVIYYKDTSGALGQLTSRSNVACFVHSCAYLLSLPLGGGYLPRLLLLSKLIEVGAFKLVSDQIVGATAKFFAKEATVTASVGSVIDVTLNLKRTDYTLTSAMDGYYILGFNRVLDTQPGEPDHYIVVEKQGDSLFCVYDPLLIEPVAFGTEVSHLFKRGGATLIRFNGSVASNLRRSLDNAIARV